MSSSQPLPGEVEIRNLLPNFSLWGLSRWRRATLEFGGPQPLIEFTGQVDLVVLAEYDLGADYVVEVRFMDVRDLVLPKIRGWTDFHHLTVDDATSMQWEGVRYRVWEEMEHGGMSSYCFDVRLTKLLTAEADDTATVLWREG